MSDTSPADTFAAKVAEAQSDLRHGIDRAGLRDDPFRHVLAGLADVVELFPDLVGEIGGAIERARQPVDAGAFEQAVKRLERAAARGADLRSAELARAHVRRTLLGVGLASVLGIAAAVGGGFFWGQATANAAVQQTEQRLAWAFQNGPATAAAWANLMRSNDAGLALAGCTGSAVRMLEGRRACSVPLWLDPPNPAAPGAK